MAENITNYTNVNLFDDTDVINVTKPKKQKKLGEIKQRTKTDILQLVERIKADSAMSITREESEKILKSAKVSLEDKLALIKINVFKVLGHQRANTLIIRDRVTLHEYISKAIESGVIAIDTETNNSLDPVTCQLMGPCLYYPGGKNAYIPLNHRDPSTKERLPWQLTEQDIKEELQRVVDAKIEIIMHNGKFDYEVIKCTCGIEVKPTWDTMVAARLLNENELAGLKPLYRKYVDPTQEKYDIEKLFNKIAYADVDPEVFALYAATDPYITYKIYLLQKEELAKPEYGPHLDLAGKHNVPGLRWLFHNVEMPIVIVTAEMELQGVKVDTAYGARLKEKYNKQLDDINDEISGILVSLKKLIKNWIKNDPDASTPQKQYVSKKSKMSEEKILAQYPYVDDIGRYKTGQCPKDLLDDPINLDSPSQLAILFYNILKVPNKATDGSRKTGKDELKIIKETLTEYLPKLEELQTEFDEDDCLDEEYEETLELSRDELEIFRYGTAAKLATAILKRRGIVKLVTTYIDVIPELVKHWPDGRIRFHLNSLGTDTGRYSSGGKLKFMENDEAIEISGINIQNIPSHNPEVRMLFTADVKAKLIEADEDDPFIIPETDEIETPDGWVLCKNLTVGDLILVDKHPAPIKSISYDAASKNYNLGV